MKTIGTAISVIVLAVAAPGSAASDWISAPKPKFPKTALQNGSEGSVRLRILLSSDGSVRESSVTKSSGDPMLDQTAQTAVLKWKLKPSAIKPTDLTKGRETIVDFKQEAPIAARYPDRTAGFANNGGILEETELAKLWISAPFPSYPFEARERREEGTCVIALTIGNEGKPENIRLVKSSGFKLLDDAALRASALWRAHKQYVGRKVTFPVRFVIGRRGRR